MSAVPSSRERYMHQRMKLFTDDPGVKSYFQYESSGWQTINQVNKFFIDGYLLPRVEPYKYGAFKVRIVFPPEYPFKQPDLLFLTYIYHKDIKDDNGQSRICRCKTSEWAAHPTIAVWIKQHVDIIDGTTNDRSNCDNHEAAQQYERNKDEYKKTAITMVEKYAYPRPDQSISPLKFIAKRIIRRQVEFNSAKIDQLPLSASLKRYLHSPFDRM